MPKLKGKIKARERQKKRKSRIIKLDNIKKEYLSKIRLYDDPVLKEKCENVILHEKQEVHKIISEMARVLMAAKNGVGLAAPQIGYTKNIIALRESSLSDKIVFMLNPVIVKKSEETKSGIEGCLSFPGVYTSVERYKTITVEYLDVEFLLHTKECKNMESIVVQHECDHLQSGFCKLYKAWKNREENKK